MVIWFSPLPDCNALPLSRNHECKLSCAVSCAAEVLVPGQHQATLHVLTLLSPSPAVWISCFGRGTPVEVQYAQHWST
jgi:hypothetical protein